MSNDKREKISRWHKLLKLEHEDNLRAIIRDRLSNLEQDLDVVRLQEKLDLEQELSEGELRRARLEHEQELLAKELIQAQLEQKRNQRVHEDMKRSVELLMSINKHRAVTKIEKPPGSRLLRLTELVFSAKSQEQIFEPIVADWQEEHFQALSQGRGKFKLFCIGVRYRVALARAAVLDSVIRAVIRLFAGS